MSERHDAETAVRRVAAQNHGVFTRAQARAAGVSDAVIRYRVQTGEWEQLANGVYRIAGAPSSDHQRLALARASAPPGALVSHLSAAWLHGLRPPPPHPHLTVAVGARSASPLGTLHRADVARKDRVVLAGLRCTAPARTVVDCSGLLPAGALADLVDAAIVGGLTTARHIREASQRIGSHRGVVNLHEAVNAWDGPIRHDSLAEARLLRCLRSWALPPPVTQFSVRRADGSFLARLDLAWPDELRNLEYDGDLWHTPRHIERDETRDQALEGLGWRTERVNRGDLRAGTDLRKRIIRLLAPTNGAARRSSA